jgi:hypothetical protein
VSPSVGITVSIPEGARRTPRMMVLSAVLEARAESIPLRFGDSGVVRGPGTAPWMIDRKEVPRGVNLPGLLLLLLRAVPEHDIEDPSATLARALGVNLAWVEGATDGWNRESHDQVALKADREKYLCGYEAGMEARLLATLVCGECGSRRFRSEGLCPGCDR